MQSYQQYQLEFINERRAREINDAAESRRLVRPDDPMGLRIRQAIVDLTSRRGRAPGPGRGFAPAMVRDPQRLVAARRPAK